MKNELIAYLDRRIEVHTGILNREEVREFKCPFCREEIRNTEYTKGFLTALNQMRMELSDY